MSRSTFDEYATSQVLTLNVLPNHGHASASVMHVRIRQLHTRTLSFTMVVDILDKQRPQTASGMAFLKLFDRRFAEQLRRDNGIEPWTKSIEQAYIDSVESGAIQRFLHDLRHIDRFQEDTEEDWDDAQNEAFLSHELLRLYDAEVAVYDALRDHQGRLIPKVIAAVDLDLATSSSTLHCDDRGDFAPFRVRGILLEYINGCNLMDIVDHFPRSSWQRIVNQAVATIRILSDHNILNNDVRPENFVVCPVGDGDPKQDPQVFMIDFALCRFRAADESDAEWGRAKHGKDEEGAIGLRMKKVLAYHDYELDYEYSQRYAEWADTDDTFAEGAVKTELEPGVIVYTRAPKKAE